MLDLGHLKMIKIRGGFRVCLSKQVVFNSVRRFSRLMPFDHHGQFFRGVHGAGNNSKNSDLSGSQVNQILEAMCMSGNVVAYRLCGIDLREVPGDLLNSMVTASRELNISGTKLSTCQLSAIFQAIQRADVLEEVEIKEENLKYVPTQRITPCIAALKRVIIDDCSNNNEPVEETKISKLSEGSLSEILLEGKSTS